MKAYPKNRKSKYDKQFKNKCRNLYSSGLSVNEVAKKMGCSGRSVSEWNSEKGINRTVSEGLKAKGCIPPSQKGKKRSIDTRRKISGNKNHFWKGGITVISKRLRMSQKMIDWRNKIFDRDKYTCQICGCIGRNDKGRPLNAHHLLIIVKYMANKFETIEDCFKYKLFWELDNGVTLCESCHKEIHRHQEILE